MEKKPCRLLLKQYCDSVKTVFFLLGVIKGQLLCIMLGLQAVHVHVPAAAVYTQYEYITTLLWEDAWPGE